MSNNESTARKSYTFGAYEIVDTAGAGGMGVVYRAIDRALGRTVALKVLRDDLRAQPVLVARFQREAETFATLNHPNIVHIYSVGCIGRIPFIAMEYIEGKALSDLLQERAPLPWQEALDIAAQVAAALSCAHDAQIIHRDVKPANILIEKNGRALVTDFGIAKVLSADTQLTQDGSRLGTPQYLCPERCQDHEITPASDIYSLGVVLFQCLTAKMPYDAVTAVEFVEKIIGEAPARVRDFVPEVPEPVDRLVAFMLEKNPSKRPGDGHALGAAIDRVRRGLPLDERVDELSQAIADFRRSMNTPTPKGKPPGSKPASLPQPKNRIKHAWFSLPRSVRLGLAATLAGVLLATATAVSYRVVRGPALTDVPLASGQAVTRWRQTPRPLAEFHDETARVRLARLPFPGMTPSAIAWAGETLGAVIRFDGKLDSDRAGQSALVAVHPDTSKTALLFAPFVTPGDWRLLDAVETAPRALDLILATPSATIKMNPETSTLPAMLADVPSRAWCIHPGEDRFALAFGGLAGDQWVVREATWAAPENKKPLTPPGPPIEAVAYSVDGKALAYLRKTANGGGELWWKTLDTNAENAGTRLATDCVRMGRAPFNPVSGELMAVCTDSAGAEELHVFDPGSGQQSHRIDKANAGLWLANGSEMLAAGPDAAGRNQLWLIPLQEASQRRQLTYLGSGVLSCIALSRDEQFAIGAQSTGADIVIVRLTE